MKYHVCWENVTDSSSFIFLSLGIKFQILLNENMLMICKTEIRNLRNRIMLMICTIEISTLRIISILPFRKLQIFISFRFVSQITVSREIRGSEIQFHTGIQLFLCPRFTIRQQNILLHFAFTV